MLILEFKKNPDWTKEQVTMLSAQSGLSESQVYKWAWDQKKKLQSTQNSHKAGAQALFDPDINVQDNANSATPNNEGSSTIGQAEVTRDEFGGYCCKRWGAGGEQKGS